MSRNKSRIGLVLLATASFTATRPAAAYNYDTHRKMVETAVYVALHPDQYVSTGASHPADFPQYIADVKAIGDKLGKLQTGIADQEGDRDDAEDANPKPWVGDPLLCGYDPHDRMDLLGTLRLEDAKYVPRRTKTAGGCGSEAPDTSIYKNPMASTLGWHAGSVDNHLHDLVMWVRPTNWLGVGAFKKVVSEIGRAVVGTLLVPIVCVFEWLFGDGCDTHDAYDLASKANPVPIIDSLVPGFGSHTNKDYPGIWHFEDIAASSGEYNHVRGMLYDGAGVDGPGVADVAIMVYFDGLGISVNPGETDGIGKYAHYDETERNSADWEAYSSAHVEFSPLHNLAKYGWDQFATYHPTSAAGLAWPLHALGDAAEPHHTWGTTSFGHRPFEAWVARQWFDLTKTTDFSKEVDFEIGSKLLEQGYHWWQLLQSTHDVGALVTALARETSSAGLFASNDYASLLHHTGSPNIALNEYQSNENTVKTRLLLENGMGAMVAFLSEAAKHAASAPAVAAACPTATPFWDGTTCSTVDPLPPTYPLVPDVCPTGPCGGMGGSGTGGSGTGGSGGGACLPNGATCTDSAQCCEANSICAVGFCQPNPT